MGVPNLRFSPGAISPRYFLRIQQAGAPETAAKSVTPIVFTCGSLITKGRIQVCIRLKAELG